MKTFAYILLLAAMGAAEPLLSRQARLRSARQQADDLPYPAAGFRPATAFELPSREDLAPPATSYGVPATSYGAPLGTYATSAEPQTEYGPPVTDAGDEAKDDVETIEGSGQNDKKEKLEEDADVVSASGAYYVLLGDGRLQRVQYRTERDDRNMAYTARLQYRAEERAPLYVYSAAAQYQPAAAAYIQLL